MKTWRRNKAAIIWEGEPGTSKVLTYRDLYREVNRFAAALKRRGVKKGDRVAIYLGMVPELPIAMLACTRIGAPHTVIFAVQRGQHRRSRQRLRREVCHHGRRRLAARQQDPAQGHHGQSDAERPTIETVLVVNRTDDAKGADEGWPRHLVAPRARRVRRADRRARAPGCRAPALHPVHVGHDRQAEGHAPHDRRLPGRDRLHAQVRLRPEGRRRLLLHGRRRLGDGPLVHRLRPAGQWRDVRHVRGLARLSRQGPLLVDRREVRRDHPVHGAHRDPHVHALGQGVPGQARPDQPARAGVGRRADQSRGLGLVSRGHRRGSLPGRRHVVDDRDRSNSHYAIARYHHSEARLGHISVPVDQGGRPRRPGQQGSPG